MELSLNTKSVLKWKKGDKSDIRISYRRPLNYGFTINNFRNRRFGFGNMRRGQRRFVFRRNVRRINNNNNLGQRRLAFRRRR